MTPAAFISEAARLSTSLLEDGVAISANIPLRAASAGRVYVSVPLRGGDLDIDIDAPFHRVDEYRRLLDAGAYLVVLKDGSLLQVSACFRGNDLVSHRYCFYPCPFDLQAMGVDPDVDLLDALESLSAQELLDQLRLLAPLRFEYSPDQATVDHPATHAHVGASSCRIPVHAPMSLGHFVRFVFRHFFPTEWAANANLRAWPLEFLNRTISLAEEETLYFECRRPAPR